MVAIEAGKSCVNLSHSPKLRPPAGASCSRLVATATEMTGSNPPRRVGRAVCHGREFRRWGQSPQTPQEVK